MEKLTMPKHVEIFFDRIWTVLIESKKKNFGKIWQVLIEFKKGVKTHYNNIPRYSIHSDKFLLHNSTTQKY